MPVWLVAVGKVAAGAVQGLIAIIGAAHGLGDQRPSGRMLNLRLANDS